MNDSFVNTCNRLLSKYNNHDYFSVLGFAMPGHYTTHQINSAFRAQVVKFHPDRIHDPNLKQLAIDVTDILVKSRDILLQCRSGATLPVSTTMNIPTTVLRRNFFGR